jgi:hypothetical protein
MSITSSQIPVLLIGHSRTETLIDLVEIALLNHVSAIYVSIDGPRDETVRKYQHKMIGYLEDYQKSQLVPIHVLQRKRNLGAGAGVVAALDWFFTLEREGIVLEDDLIVDDSFFEYVREALPKIYLDPKILSVSGTRLLPTTDSHATLSSYPLAWGWATTREKWLVIRELIFQKPSSFQKHGSIQEWIFWLTGKRRALRSYVDAWDIPLAEGMSANGFYTLVPPVNLVTNVGFDRASTHTARAKWPLGLQRAQILSTDLKVDLDPIKTAENDVFMRKRVFAISVLNIITGAVAQFFDPIRYLKLRKSESLQAKVDSERTNK